jgi:hypothetical protein
VTAQSQSPQLANSQKAGLVTLVLACGLALGVLGDVLLRVEPWGPGFGLWTLALGALGAALIARRDGRVSNELLLWLALAVILAWTFTLRNDGGLYPLTLLGIVAAFIGARTVAARSPVRSVLGARVLDVLRSAAAAVFDVAIGLPRLLLADIDPFRRNPSGGSELLAWARPVLIALPILLVFTVLLVSADPVFGSWFRLPWDFATVVSHAFLTLVLTWIVAGGLRGAVLGGGGVAVAPLPPIRFGNREVAVVLGGIAILFLAFVATQIGWLFGGEALVQRTTGLSYAEYARRGFFELLAVSALLLPILLIGRATLGNERSVTLFQRLSVVVLVLLLAILISAAARLELYVRYYRLTDDRLYAVAVLVWLTLVWAWFAATVLRERPRLFAVGAIVAAYGALAALHIVGPDRTVARFNLANPNFGGVTRTPVDYAYLATLGGDAVPPLVDALARPPLSPQSSQQWTGEIESRCQAATSLLRRWGPGGTRNANEDWRSWNLAVARAQAAVRERENEFRQMSCIVNGELVPFSEFTRRKQLSPARRPPATQPSDTTPSQR